MKKFLRLFAIFLLPATLLLSSCSDENDLPQVNINVNLDGVTEEDGVLYVVQGEPFKVISLTVTSLNGNNSALTNVGYYWDGFLSAVTNISPFACEFDTAGLAPGNHSFQIKMTVLQVDKSVGISWVGYHVKVVEKAEDIPSGSTHTGSIVLTGTSTPK